MGNVHLFTILTLVFFACEISLSFSRLNQGDIFSKRMDVKKRSNESQRELDSGGIHNDDAFVQPQDAENNSRSQVETISNIVDETLRKAVNKGNAAMTVPDNGMNVKPKLPPQRINSIVNHTVSKVMANPSAGLRLNQGDIFSKRMDIKKRSNESQRELDSGGIHNDDAFVQPQDAENNSRSQVETISNIVDETLRKAANKGNAAMTVPDNGMNVKPKLPPQRINSIVNHTVSKVMANPSAGLRLNQGDIFSKRMDIKKRSNDSQRELSSGGMNNDDAFVQPQKAGNNSSPQVETISSIVNETLREAANETQENTTVLPETGMKGKPKLPPHRISSIVNHTVFKVIANTSRDDPSAGSAMDRNEGSGSGSGSGYITCEMCPSCVGCVVVPAPAASPPVDVAHVDYFHGNPCLHGGELQEFPNGTFVCMCPVGFKGKNCRDLLYCHSNPCKNNGTCIEDANGFKCICPKGFKGCVCEEFSSCEPNPCENDGVCIQIDNSFNCACKPGYQGKRCKDTDPCFVNPCHNGGTCTVIQDKANCSCTEHYGGDYCQVEKICYDNPCHNGATCVENPTRPCICAQGYAGRLCSKDVCRPNKCLNGGVCEVVQATTGGNDKWTYSCTCPVFFQGKDCEVSNFCKGDPCKNKGTCVDLYRQNQLSKRWINLMRQHAYYKCFCPPGYTGKQCETDICDSCHDHAVCVDHRCVCNSGYTGDGFDCTEIASPCHPNPCRNGATCSIGPDLSYDCKCPKGYCGEHCQLICDICALKPCMNGGSCYASGDGRVCVCPPQYTGPECNILLPDPCQPNPCMHNFPCKNQKEKHDYICECQGKYSGKNCQNCDCPKAKSIPGKTTYDSFCDAVGDCVCPMVDDVALTFDGHDGCVEGKTEQLCFPNPCLNGGSCLVKSNREEYCVCKSPYYGDRCQYKLCDVANPCQNGGTCLDIGVKDYKCRCTQQFTGVNCTVPAPEPVVETLCYPSPCLYGGTCKERGNGYDCICHIRFTGPNCEVDRCSDCDVNADCVDGHCRCRQGYIGTGYVCEIDDSECGSVVCPTDNQQCVSGQCVCIPGTTCITNK